jgi:hypothetical protein
MLCPVKVFDKEGNLKKIISTEKLQKQFWEPRPLKPKGNRNCHFFVTKTKHSSEKLDRKFARETSHPKIP